MLLIKKMKIKKMALIVMALFIFVNLFFLFNKGIVEAQTNGESNGNGYYDDNGDSCEQVDGEEWYQHYDHKYITKPTVKVTITDNKYKVLSPEGKWEPLKFSFFIETKIVDETYHH